ncbi:sugar diacid recognition domain-containing protein [Virgibacillus sp. C22-A2]|uniref:Sugar diacid recognition domain-containing protein n=1 Tax=Virgibacillus tibetensis TaxID=3042313 RepID=A0ABU6KD81_9BACI|nr:sugar diacid recognition domain-containing protein [Virgibacillus sp. C22-A2]
MQITSELGQEIIKRLAEYIDVDINIMDLDGIIVASTNEERINELHRGAIEVINQCEELILDQGNIQQYPSTKPGVNLPIMHQQNICGVVGVSGEPEEIIRITGLIRVSVEIVLEQIYIQRQAYYKEIQWSNWLHQLLHPSGMNEEKLKKEALYTLKINLEEEWRVIVLCAKDVHEQLEYFRSEIEMTREEILCALPFSEDEIVIVTYVTAQLEKLVKPLTETNVRIGIGETGCGLNGIRQSYKQAKQALYFDGGESTVSYSDKWKLERLINSISLDEYSSICLPYENLLSNMEETYKETIDTYLEMNFSIKETAKILHIHRNTLLYRLEQVKEKTGLDPRLFHDAFLLKIIRSSLHCANAQ